MKIDNLQQYISSRDALRAEKADLEARLKQINGALGEAEAAIESAPSAPASKSTAAAAPKAQATGRRGRPPAGGMSLKAAVLQALGNKAMTKQEILDGVQGLGYKFNTSNPLNSLGVILYGKSPKFRNDGGRFSLAGGGSSSAASSASSGPSQAASSGGRGKRQMSPEARARIAAAARARWKKAKAAGRSTL